MPTYNADVLPAATGYNLGSAVARWNIYAQDVNVNGTLSVTGSLTGSYPAYAKASLPSTASAGQVARVTDTSRDLWMYQGAQWFSLNEERANVKEFGAVGDGITNDTAAIKNAIASLTGGGIVYFPQGTYLVTSTIPITTNRIRIVGAGFSSIITCTGTFTLDMLSIAADNCSIENIQLSETITNSNTAYALAAIRSGTQNRFIGVKAIGNRVKTALPGTVGFENALLVTGDKSLVHGCWTQDVWSSGIHVVGAAAASSIISNNHCENHSVGVTLDLTASVIVAGNHCQKMAAYNSQTPCGVWSGGSQMCEITGNLFQDSAVIGGIDQKNMIGVFVSSLSGTRSLYLSITGNTTRNLGPGSTTQPSAAFQIINSDNIAICGNSISDNGVIMPGAGILLQDCNYSTVSGNVLEGFGFGATGLSSLLLINSSNNVISGNSVCDGNWSGIELIGTASFGGTQLADNNTITGNACINNDRQAAVNIAGIKLTALANRNSITGNTCNTRQKYGLMIANANCNKNIYLSNILYGNVTAAVSDTGTGTEPTTGGLLNIVA